MAQAKIGVIGGTGLYERLAMGMGGSVRWKNMDGTQRRRSDNRQRTNYLHESRTQFPCNAS